MSDERDPGSSAAPPAMTADLARGVARGDRVHAFQSDAISVTWSRRRCTHAAECVMRLPTVFEPGRAPWVDATAAAGDAIAEVVQRCPTGALHFERHDGGAAEAVPTANSVLVSRDGPLLLRGDIEVRDDDGNVLLRDTRVALCRCGLSKAKPLCDNAHRAARFRDAGDLRSEDAVQDPGGGGSALRVTPHEHESLELSGPFVIGSGDGQTMQGGTSVWLCRCGGSQDKPFCDGSHARVGFESR
ncbi:MAG: CDGSH iron-sulfur domain-containing protein [Candidatus Eisenbacteria bacterium]